MSEKIKVGILFGGRSAEHEVSLQSARNVIQAIDRKKYEILLIGIDKDGRWFLLDNDNYLINEDDPANIKLNKPQKKVTLLPWSEDNHLISIDSKGLGKHVDVIFPVLHGTYGEDGTIQGLLKLANIPFVGAGVLGSSVGMDKDVMKRLFLEAGIPTPRFITVKRGFESEIDFDKVVETLGLPLFIKPANLGSSVGVNKAKDKGEFMNGLNDAFKYDNKILLEEYIVGREIECSVLGNERPMVSLPGEIIAQHEFYSYKAKYLDEKGAILKAPAELPEESMLEIQKLAVSAFKVLCCEGMARVDFFLKGDDELFVNELNTIPGFTEISMYPKLWKATGVTYTELIDRLLQLAMERFEREKKLETSFDF
jgi:D-alanine-D-alanine ligase